MTFDSRLPADQIASLEVGDRVTFETSAGGFSYSQLQTGKVVRLTPKQVIVQYAVGDRTILTRFRKADARKVGEGYGELLDPTHPRTVDRLARDRRDRRQRYIDALAHRWPRERDNLNVLRELQTAVGEYLDAEADR